MSIPSSIGLPNEMMLGSLDYSLPSDARSTSIKIQPSNISQIVSPTYTCISGNVLDLPFPSQNLLFDIPCGGSPSQFLDTRFTTLNYRMTINVISAGTASTVTTGFLRSHANSFFDRLTVINGSGAVIEDIAEYALTQDTLLALSMSNSIRDGIATQYGFNSDTSISSQGHALGIFTNTTLAASQSESHAYSIPLLSSVIGVTNDKFINVGRLSKIQLVLQTTSVLPLSILCGSATTGGTFSVTLSDFSLQCEYIDIGNAALALLDRTLIDNKCYSHGVTYRTSTATLNATTGSISLLAGIRASSVKSLFARFYENGTLSTTNSSNGKYDSKNPCINSIAYNISGTRYPQVPINPLLSPAQAFRETQMAIGSFNSSQFTSSIPVSQYCKLSSGGTNQALTLGSSQDYNYTTGSDPAKLCQFIFGENVEICAKRSLLSGLNCSSAPVFLELNIATQPTNQHTVYVTAMIDSILIHDVVSGELSTRT
jgi:hypothetical protein